MITERGFSISLTTLEPFRIGGIADPMAAAENPVALVGSRATIPGSSLKGALRASIEEYLISLYYDQQNGQWRREQMPMQPCMAGTRLSQGEEKLVREGKYRREQCIYPLRNQNGSICPACYLLGAQGLTGFVRVPFLFSEVSPDALYSARIDRATHTVAQGTNRPYQLIPPQAKFEGMLYLTLSDDVLGWTLGQPRPSGGDVWLRNGSWSQQRIITDFLVERLESLRLLGGYKSKGFGKVKITVTPCE
jgi:CRISPR/Cas system CSM-associated protein Csm3 (group 7 of RAMP superfamily)